MISSSKSSHGRKTMELPYFFQWCHHHRYIIALLWVIFLPQLIQAKDYDLCI
ncbi:hypothetical protein F7C95_09715 [Opitutia bacterium ISCC 51]|nr:hypothetical protein F7C95_09715 [Opitutae bacterium ISCC 51]QXD30193.1 hypothetical protein GA003_09660 [Opitutae bacterium ISCC 52]